MTPDPLDRAIPREKPFPVDFAEGETSAYEDTKLKVGNQARQYASELKQGSEEAYRSAKETGNNYMIEQKEKVVSWLEGCCQVLEAGCERLESGEGNPLAAPAHRAANQLQRAAGYLRNHQPSEFLDDIGAFARRRPELIYGGLFIAGLAAMRFMKATARSNNETARDQQRFGPTDGPRDYELAEIYSPRSAPLGGLSSDSSFSSVEESNESTQLP